MRYPLYSELRTAYESTSENPRTFRVTIKLKDMVDEAVLYDAVQKTMERYPYYRVALVRNAAYAGAFRHERQLLRQLHAVLR